MEPTDANAQGQSAQGAGQPVDPSQGAFPAGQNPTPFTPPTYQSAGASQPAGSGVTPPKNDLSGIMDENVDVSNLVANAGQNKAESAALLQMPIAPHPNTTFDEKKFLELLAGSISLTVNEKRKIVEAIPKLSQFQVDELMKIFTEELGKFAELEKKHADQIAELEKQHQITPQDLEQQQQEEALRNREQEEAERIKAQLGLGGASAPAMFELMFYINGQFFGKKSVPNTIQAHEAIATAKQDPNVAAAIQGRQITGETYVPGQMVSIMVA